MNGSRGNWKLSNIIRVEVMGEISQQEIRHLYCSLMEEAKVRVGVINLTYSNESKLPPTIVREICYLQFRFLCEIIALACLAAHSDIKESQTLKGTYEPGKIIKRLEKLNPHFYPQPIERARNTDLQRTTLTIRPDIKHLSRKELPVLWGRAGDILHRGSMTKVLESEKSADNNHSDIFDWSEKITGLLNSHWITLVENKKGMLVTLVTEETKRTAATIFDFDTGGSSVDLSSTYIADPPPV